MPGFDVVLAHPSSDPVWNEILGGLAEGIPVIAFGYTDTWWSASTVPLSVVSTVNAYFLYGGAENIQNLVRYVQAEVVGMDVAYDPPQETHWEGAYHPDAERIFDDADAYLAWYPSRHPTRVGLLLSRTRWANGDFIVEDTLIRSLEDYYDVLPVFCFGISDEEIGARSTRDVVEMFFEGRVSALIDARAFTPPRDADAFTRTLEGLGVPVFHPLFLYHQTEAEWRDCIDGMRGSNVSWYVAMPEFLGGITMMPIGAAGAGTWQASTASSTSPWMSGWRGSWPGSGGGSTLRRSRPPGKRVAFILHNKPAHRSRRRSRAEAHLIRWRARPDP